MVQVLKLGQTTLRAVRHGAKGVTLVLAQQLSVVLHEDLLHI